MKIYKVKEAAEILGMHPDTIREKIRRGELKAKNVATGKRPEYRITEKAIAEYVKS